MNSKDYPIMIIWGEKSVESSRKTIFNQHGPVKTIQVNPNNSLTRWQPTSKIDDSEPWHKFSPQGLKSSY